MNDINILVVEDDSDLREVLSEFMARKVKNVFSAANGQEAMEVINSQKIDIVLSDVQMPVMDGIELLESIMAKSGHQPKVLLATGHSSITEAEAISKGAKMLINKPFSFDMLENIIKGLVADNR